ncbi:MAG: GAF domain-containing protein [Bacilli bacterium]|jgi:L-methionine (R)-S-oxide reductase|nr:GAF domain-containing protein [Bacilli bacterium]
MNAEYQAIIDYVDKSQKAGIYPLSIEADIVNLLKADFPKIDWVGFYLADERKQVLYVGPYVGELACSFIPFNKGVCGKAYWEQKTQLSGDVTSLPYHIACSSTTQSEIVLPVENKHGKVIGVLDIDSDAPDAFTAEDQEGLEALLKVFQG